LKENSKLKKEIVELKDQLKFSQHRKDSTNSSMASSSNLIKSRNTNSLREVSTKKAGGQKGHKGTTLRIQEHADVTTNHFPESCSSCGKSLSVLLASFSGRRQSVDFGDSSSNCYRAQNLLKTMYLRSLYKIRR